MARTARSRVLRISLPTMAAHRPDMLAVEEPLEIRIDGQPLTVTMRTPGDDIDLTAGFLLTEDIISGAMDVAEIRKCDDNVADVRLRPGMADLGDIHCATDDVL